MKTLILTAIMISLLTACGPQSPLITLVNPPTTPMPRYAGCFADAPARSLPVFLIQTNATIESCIETATLEGYRYAGVEYGTQCFAGNVLVYPAVSNSECNMPCNANHSETCGGYWLLSVYTTGV